MAKKSSIRSISQQLGISPSTVFRALNSCGDVNPETSACVREMARAQEYRLPEREELPLCALILPDKPDFFWGEIRRLFQRMLSRFPYRVFLYAHLEDTVGFASALSHALADAPSLLVIAAPDLPSASDLLRRVSVPVFFFCESVPMVNTFFFGSDPYADGYALGQAFALRNPQCRQVLCVGANDWSEVSRLRTEGFLQGNPNLSSVGEISVSGLNKPYAASLLARRISEIPSFDCVYCNTGILPDVCCALDKCRIPLSVSCVGFENPPSLAPYRSSGRVALVSMQDLDRQVALCTDAVDRFLSSGMFPDKKQITVPSSIL